MEQLKEMKTILMGQVQAQLGHLENVDTKELGEAVDMIKDLSEAIYYCTITEAMEGKEKEEKSHNMYYIPHRDMERPNGKMYYEEPYNYGGRMYYGGGSNGGSGSMGGNGGNSGSSRTYREYDYYPEMRDMREGRSPISRKTYMESKEMHHDKSKQMQELEKYMQELSTDIIEMIEDASPEEKQVLQKKLMTLSQKVM